MRLALLTALTALVWPAVAQQGAEACKTVERGIDRLECFDRAFGVERKLADPLPAVKVKPLSVRPDGSLRAPLPPTSPEPPIAPERL